MDQASAALVEQSLLQVAQNVEEQLDAQIHQLENLGEDDLERIRRRRMDEYRRLEKNKETWLARGHGALSPTTEKDFFKEMKGEERLVCLFYRASPACEVMEKHLRILAAGHIETKFIMIEAEKAPFLAERLKIWMLPTLAIVKNEKTTDYIVGLDDMGGVEDFDTGVLEGRLIDAGVLFESRREGCRADGGGAVSQTNIRKGGTEGRRQFSSLGDGDEDSDFDDQ